jgi:hypothetical protein
MNETKTLYQCMPAALNESKKSLGIGRVRNNLRGCHG